MEKYAIMLLNLAHPSNQCAVFLHLDEDENPVLFDSHQSTRAWIQENIKMPFAGAVIDISDLDFIYPD